MADSPILKFAVIGDVGIDNVPCMAGVSKITRLVKKLGVDAVLVGDSERWRLVKVDSDPSFDLGNAVRSAFSENRDNLDLIEEKGVPFLLCNTKEMFEDDWRKFAEKNDGLLKKSAVYFYAQSYAPSKTGIGYFLPKQDRGCVSEVFKGRANCIALSSGALGPLADERAVSQGDFGFTSVCTSSFRYVSLLPGRENSRMKAPLNRPGLVVSVFSDRAEIKRVLFATGAVLGEDWVVSPADYGALSYEKRAKNSSAPSFAANAKPRIRLEKQKAQGNKEKDCVCIEFPRATGSVRALDYEVTVHCNEGDIDTIVTQRRVYSPGIFEPINKEPKTVTCYIPKEELYYEVPLQYEVRPVNSFGVKGNPIFASRTIKKDSIFKKG
ncbi:MAG: hypothetical protein J6R18_02220 [Kiritimatiellae bacterium]|nr:hypothetical protein [Kiritimatiellia bacterium]